VRRYIIPEFSSQALDSLCLLLKTGEVSVARGYHRVLRVARTLADLDGADKVGRVHLAEALSYRALADEIRRAA
jgi:predicted ATPase with chaperone activity